MLKFRLLNPRDGQRQFPAPDALHFACPGVGVQLGQGEKPVAGLYDPTLHSQPVEQRAVGLLLAGCDSSMAKAMPQRVLPLPDTVKPLRRVRGRSISQGEHGAVASG